MRLVHVLLDDPAATVVCCVLDDPIVVTAEVDALTLSHVVWLDNVSLAELLRGTPVLVDELVLELAGLHRHHPRLGEEVILLWVDLLHLHEVPGHGVLSGDNRYAWELVHFLVRLHLTEKVRRDPQIVPRQVPLFPQLLTRLPFDNTAFMILWILLKPEATTVAAGLFNYVIVSAVDVHDGLAAWSLIIFLLHHEHVHLSLLLLLFLLGGLSFGSLGFLFLVDVCLSLLVLGRYVRGTLIEAVVHVVLRVNIFLFLTHLL